MSEVTDWLPTAAGNAVAFDDIDNRDGVARSKVKANFRAIMAAVKRQASSSVTGLNLKANGATGDGTTDDTTNANLALASASFGSTVSVPDATFVTTGLTVAALKPVRLIGTGRATLKAKAGAGVLLNFVPDVAAAVAHRLVRDMTMDGSGVDQYAYRPGVTGVKFGDATSGVIQPTVEHSFIHNVETGLHHYGSQEALNFNVLAYRNKIGLYGVSDPVNGGLTAVQDYHCTYQFNQVGVLLDCPARFALGTTATLTNSSTAVTGVANMTGVTVGMFVTGPGIPSGATVAGGITGTGFTLSAATSATAAMTKTPILIKNGAGYDTGVSFDGTTIQGNYVAGFAAFGCTDIFLAAVHFENNHVVQTTPGTTASGSASITGLAADNGVAIGMEVVGMGVPVGAYVIDKPTTTTITLSANATASGTVSLTFNPRALTVGGRVLLPVPVLLDNTEAQFDTCRVSESYGGIATIQMQNGAYARFVNCTGSSTGKFIDGDMTCSAAFYGHFKAAIGMIRVPVVRWPDTVDIGVYWSAFGAPILNPTRVINNDYAGASAQVPTFAVDGGSFTLGTALDPLMGPAATVQLPATVGAVGTNSVHFAVLDGNISAGDTVLISFLLKADRYTEVSYAVTNGNYLFSTLPIGPGVQRVVLAFTAPGTNSGVSGFVYPANTDGALLTVSRMMQVRVPRGGDLSVISNVLRNGLFNDGLQDFKYTAIPTTGTWKVGQRVFNSAPAVGAPKSWVCTVAGTPGTWVSEGNL